MLVYFPKALKQFQHQAPKKNTASTIPWRQTQLRSKGTVCGRHGHVHIAPQGRKIIHPGDHWHSPLLCTMCWQHHACSIGVYCYKTGKPDWEHDEKVMAISGRCLYSSWCNRHIPCKWNGPRGSQRRIIRLLFKGTQPCGWTFLHVQQHCQTTKQWRHPLKCTNNQGGHVLSDRGWDGRSIHKLQSGRPRTLYSQIYGSPTTSNTNANGQTTALGINNKVIKKLKAMDMKYHWLRNRESWGRLQHYWAPGKENNGNYVTKHHVTIHHQATPPTFLTNISTLQALHQQLTGNLPVARVR